MNAWYTLYTRPQSEYQVAEALKHLGCETYLPESVQGGRKQPFFPCYLFARLNFGQMEPTLRQWIPGLRWIVAFEGYPTQITDGIIELIRSRLERFQAAGEGSAGGFYPGESVHILQGPLKDTLAIFEGPSQPAERVQVLLTFLGQVRRVQVALSNLERVAGATPVTPACRPSLKRVRRTRGRGRRIKERV